MKFALASNDANRAILDILIRKGWTLHKLFVSTKDWLDDHQVIIDRAIELGAPVQNSRIRQEDLHQLKEQGCSVLLVASYQWKIPNVMAAGIHAVNFHPSPLPEGRGPYPLVKALLDRRRSWAVSCHQLVEQLDAGPILDREPFDLAPDETHDTLRLKCQMAFARLTERISDNFLAKYAAACPQTSGSYWPRWSKDEQTLHFNRSSDDLNTQMRAFGRLGCMALITGREIWVRQGQGWQDSHRMAPGTVVHATNLNIVLATSDGYFAIVEWSVFSPNTLLSNRQN